MTAAPALPPVPAGPGEADWAEAVALLQAHPEPVLVCHVNPDGDSLGSALALAHALRTTGRRPLVTFTEPFVVPESLRMLPGLELLVPPQRIPDAPDLLVTFDTGSVDRLGDLAPLVRTAGAVLVVDHHASNTRFGSTHLVDVVAAATVVLVDELLQRLAVPLDQDIAACLYTGLVTDTGSFKYASTTPAVHELAARLLATGIRHDLISRELWDSHPFGYAHMLSAVLARTTLERDAARGLGLVWTWSTMDDLTANGLGLDQVEGVIDVVRTAREAEVAVVCKELPDGSFAVSMRSRGRIDVAAVSTALGGGGHRLAAGFSSDDDLEPTMKKVRDCLEAAAARVA